MLSKRQSELRVAKESAKTEKGPEKMNAKVERSYKVMGLGSSESSIDAGKKSEPKKPKVGEQVSPLDTKKARDGHSSPPQLGKEQTVNVESKESPVSPPDSKETLREQDSANYQIVWLSRLNCYYLECCFTTVLGAGKTTGKSINDAAAKMLLYLNSLVNF